jgi:recombinational DNA repair ATPase RecF
MCVAYRRALEARNELLARPVPPMPAPRRFEEALARQGACLMAARRAYVERLRPVLRAAIVAAIAGKPSTSTLCYRPSLDIAPPRRPLAAALARWAEDRDHDRERGFTGSGARTPTTSALASLDRSARTLRESGPAARDRAGAEDRRDPAVGSSTA